MLIDEIGGWSISTLRFLSSAEAASQSLPYYTRLNYSDIFKIQQVRNPFTLNPVSYSRLASYLECPRCTLEQKRKRKSGEPKHFSPVQQGNLFGREAPDARLVGTLLHTLINMLHEPQSLLTKETQERLLVDRDALRYLLRHDAISLLQQSGKIKLAMLLDDLLQDRELLHTTIIAPMLLYQREFILKRAVVLAASERFQFKLLSTGKTFDEHRDWGDQVAFVGEFDQIRMRKIGPPGALREVPAIMEFKKGLGARNQQRKASALLFEEPEDERELMRAPALPTMSHAMQLMVYWLAFQTRWNIFEHVVETKGMVEEIRMPVRQQLDLIIYNLNDGYQYQLMPTDYQEALSALTTSIFYLNWAMKSGYALRAPEHDCKKTQLVEAPDTKVEVGATTISGGECYQLAREAFERFEATVRWKLLPPG